MLGGVIVTKKGETQSNGYPKGVDREFVYYFSSIDESLSPYFESNLIRVLNKTLLEIPYRTNPLFSISNVKPMVSGFLYNNNPFPPTMYR